MKSIIIGASDSTVDANCVHANERARLIACYIFIFHVTWASLSVQSHVTQNCHKAKTGVGGIQ